MSSIIQEVSLLFYKITFRAPIVYLREPFFKWQNQIRVWRWKKQVISKHCMIHPSIEIRGKKNFIPHIIFDEYCVLEKDCLIWIADDEGANPVLNLANNVYIGRDVYLGVYQPLYIGHNSLIGAYSYIITANHQFKNRDIPIRLQGYTGAPISIGDDVWIGCHVVILPGVTIGNGAIIAAGAVINRDVPSFEIWGGVPARKLGQRGEVSS